MCRCRCGLSGSSGPGDARVSYRSSPPGGKWVQWAGGKWETSPANEDVMDTDKKKPNLNLRYCQWHQPSSSRLSKPLAFGSFLDKSSGLPARTDPWWIGGLVSTGLQPRPHQIVVQDKLCGLWHRLYEWKWNYWPLFSKLQMYSLYSFTIEIKPLWLRSYFFVLFINALIMLLLVLISTVNPNQSIFYCEVKDVM